MKLKGLASTAGILLA